MPKQAKAKAKAKLSALQGFDDEAWDDDPFGSEASEGASDDGEGPAQEVGELASPTKGAPGKQKAGKKRDRDVLEDKQCARRRCAEQKHGKEQLCNKHKRSVDNMRSQANEVQAKADLKVVLADDDLANCAIDDFDEKNVQGKYGRKQLIDWQEFNRAYFTSRTKKDRSKELEYTFGDFEDECKMKGWTDSRIKAQRASYVDDRNIDREGAGTFLILWIPQRRERILDTTKGFVNDYREGGQRHKVLSPHEAINLKEFADRSIPFFADDFCKKELELSPRKSDMLAALASSGGVDAAEPPFRREDRFERNAADPVPEGGGCAEDFEGAIQRCNQERNGSDRQIQR